MSIDENELRYDRHKQKVKTTKSKKNKTGKKRTRIQVGGSKQTVRSVVHFGMLKNSNYYKILVNLSN